MNIHRNLNCRYISERSSFCVLFNSVISTWLLAKIAIGKKRLKSLYSLVLHPGERKTEVTGDGKLTAGDRFSMLRKIEVFFCFFFSIFLTLSPTRFRVPLLYPGSLRFSLSLFHFHFVLSNQEFAGKAEAVKAVQLARKGVRSKDQEGFVYLLSHWTLDHSQIFRPSFSNFLPMLSTVWLISNN